MRLYLDDDSARSLLVKLLIRAGHDVQTPADATLDGASDPKHFRHTILNDRVLLSGNHGDFLELHSLVLSANGHHPGILIVRKDNDQIRDLSPRGIVTAIRNLISSGLPVADQLIVLNHWR
jgi:uncharacterized protein DUF5615